MRTSSFQSARAPGRGSALISVLIFTTILLLLSGSVLQWTRNESKMTTRSANLIEARNAAEAVEEYGCYLVAQAFNTSMNPTFGTGGTTTISFPSSVATSFFAGSNIDPTSIQVKAGSVTQVPSGRLYYIDPSDPNNRYDPLSGRYVFRRDVTVIAQATATPPTGTGGTITAYVTEKVSVRGAPLFAYAIFYSGNDLEVDPQPQMDIFGPVHVNGNLFVGPVGTSALSFHGPVTASGSVFHSWRGTSSTAQEGSTMNATTAVNFSSNIAGTSTASMRSSGGVWQDSTMGADASTYGLASLLALVTTTASTNFSKTASQLWAGNLQTAAMGIQSYNPMGYNEVVGNVGGTNILATDPLADSGGNVGTGAGFGHGYGPHALIEPPLVVSSTDTYSSAKAGIEQQKFSRKAGLYVQVTVTATNTATVKLFGDPNSAPSGTPAANIGPNGGLLLGTAPANLIQYIPYTASGSGTTTTVSKGLYDQQQNTGVNLVQVNMGVLKTALTDMTTTSSATVGTDIVTASGAKWGGGTSNGYDTYTNGSTGWNGGLYVEVANASSTMTGIILSNGTVASGSSLVPTGTSAPNAVTGLTVATNAPVYVLGNYNADGTIGSAGTANSAQYPDDGKTGASGNASAETPAAIAADSVTILSANYFGTAATTHNAPASQASGSAFNSFKTIDPSSGGSVEVAAAMITGTNTTSPDSGSTQQYSGGVHNLPRFLENWSGLTVAIRGSLVSMYNSRVASTAWGADYYTPPTRSWGFDQLFANGNFPPICPQVISYRRAGFSYLANSASYSAIASGL